jgi:hypothetical protein
VQGIRELGVVMETYELIVQGGPRPASARRTVGACRYAPLPMLIHWG